MASHSQTFPNESPAYRAARNQLLDAEIELRRNVERVAVLRRQLPLGGEIPEDYIFDDGDSKIKLSQLFEDGKDTLVVYNFMYGPKMEAPCPMCSAMLDSLNGAELILTQRVNLAVAAKSSIERIRTFARERGWNNFHLLSSADNNYNRDYHGENEDGSQWPALNVFKRRDGKIYHTYCTELMFTPADPGQDPRHVDMIWPLWNMLDLTPEGRGDWRPKLRYK